MCSVNHEPFELRSVDLFLNELKERREFRPRACVVRSMLSESFLEYGRSREYDINLEEVRADNPKVSRLFESH